MQTPPPNLSSADLGMDSGNNCEELRGWREGSAQAALPAVWVCPTAYFIREHLAGAKIKTLLDFIEMMASGLQKTLSKKRKKKQGKPQSKDKNVLCTHLTETSVKNVHSTTQSIFSRQRTRNGI